MKKVLEYVGDTATTSCPTRSRCCRSARCTGASRSTCSRTSAFRYRTWHKVTGRRLVVAVLLGALVPLAAEMPALAALGLLAAVMVVMIATESVQYSEVREQIRHEDDPRKDDPMEAVEEHID